MKNKLIIIYPYKFTFHIYQLLEVDKYEKFYDVYVWDLSKLLYNKKININSRSEFKKENIIHFNYSLNFFYELVMLKKNSSFTKSYFINEMYSSTYKSFIFNIFLNIILKIKYIPLIMFYNAGAPIISNWKNDKENNLNILKRLYNTISQRKSFKEKFKWLKGHTLRILSLIFKLNPNYVLVAGTVWEKHLKCNKIFKPGFKIIYGHSFDYSRKFLQTSQNNENIITSINNKQYAVFLDSAGPMYPTDGSIIGKKSSLTIENWYPSLVFFFNQLEEKYNLEVIIAGHYKSNYAEVAECFGNRKVYYNLTHDLIKYSKFVISRASTAISFAIIYYKPIIFIYSDELLNDSIQMFEIKQLAELLNSNIVNINSFTTNEINLLKINLLRFNSYITENLSSSNSNKQNFQLIIEELEK